MNLFLIVLIPIAAFILAYISYGKFLSKWFGLDDKNPTPACKINDGIDYVPAKSSMLLGQHFSAIAAAGPIVGPILAGLWFGWGPALLWIIVGAIFIGAVHDFSSLVSSVRHNGNSIAEVVKQNVGQKAYIFFLLFIWISLIYVIIVFADLTCSSFVEPLYGGAVASSSFLYLILGVVMGFCLYKFKMPLWLATIIFVPLVGLAIWYGKYIPLIIPFTNAKLIWNFIILGYCFIASIVPVWTLLQSRGYLGGVFLYGTLIFGLIGLFLGGVKTNYPIFIGFVSEKGIPLFPILFITVACGACSGFHAIVSTGTTSKQIAKEKDSLIVGYGGMLLEGVVAVLALSTLIMLPAGNEVLKQTPDRIFANGLSQFIGRLGINPDFARSFALLVFATFIYDTLDVTTRLGRYILQELTGWKNNIGRINATIITLLVPAIYFCIINFAGGGKPAWQTIWSIFGASNQLLAALTLLGISAWLAKTGKNILATFIPFIFMTCMTVWALLNNIILVLNFKNLTAPMLINSILATVVLIIGILIIKTSIPVLFLLKTAAKRIA